MNPLPSLPDNQNRDRNWWERTFARLYYYILFSDTDLLELVSMAATFVWGFWTALPWRSFRESSASRALESLMPQHAYGLLMLVLAIIQLCGLTSRNIYLRRISNMCACFFWGFLSILFLMDNFHAAEGAVYAVLALAAALVYLRTRRYYVLRN